MDDETTFLGSIKTFVASELDPKRLGLDIAHKLEKVYGKNDARAKRARLDVFFRAYALVGTPYFAAQIAGLNHRAVEKVIKANPALQDRFDQAHDEFCQFLEQAAIVRALRKSDTLLMFELRANNPRKFSERLRIASLNERDDKPLNVVFGDPGPNYAKAEDEDEDPGQQ